MRVFLADGHYIFRAGLVPLVKQLDQDIVIQMAASYSETLGHLRKADAFDLVVIDPFMVSKEPMAGLRTIREAARRSVVVALSSSTSREDAVRCLGAGATGYLPKTADAAEILKGLRAALKGYLWAPDHLLKETTGGTNDLPLRTRTRSALQKSGLKHLTPRQHQVLDLLAKGMDNAEIAQALGLSVNTVKMHVSAILRTLRVSNRTEAARLVIGQGGSLGTPFLRAVVQSRA